MQPITALFFGSQGAGKGTQVKMLIEYLNKKSDNGVIHIDMGAELRAMIASGSYSSPLVQNVLNQGARMPDFMPIYLQTRKVVEQLKTGKEHIIADGLARGADQTRGFDDMMTFYDRKDFQIIYLTLSEESSVKRLLARGRVDDTEDAIRKRLAWSKTDMMPQLQLLKERQRVVHEIDGEPDVETIHKNILSVLGLAQ